MGLALGLGLGSGPNPESWLKTMHSLVGAGARAGVGSNS